MARFTVNFVHQGRLYKCGEEVAEEDIPAFVRKYVVKAADGHGLESEPVPVKAPAQKSRSIYVRRGFGFKMVTDEVELVPGEQLFCRQPGSNPPRFVRAGRVRDEVNAA